MAPVHPTNLLPSVCHLSFLLSESFQPSLLPPLLVRSREYLVCAMEYFRSDQYRNLNSSGQQAAQNAGAQLISAVNKFIAEFNAKKAGFPLDKRIEEEVRREMKTVDDRLRSVKRVCGV